MLRPVVLLVDSDPARLAARCVAVRRAGYYALPARTLGYAWLLLRKVRVAAVVAAAHLDDGRSLALLRELRDEAFWADLPLAVLGPVSAAERAALAADPLAQVREDGDEVALLAVLAAVSGRPAPRLG